MRVQRGDDNANFAIIGRNSADGSAGAIYFHDTEVAAEVDAAQLSMLPGTSVRVVPCIEGKLEANLQREVDLLVHELLKEICGRNTQ